MKKRRLFQVVIGVVSLLLIGTLLYASLRDNDPYRYYTGLGERITVAPDDLKFAFSYYVDGQESIYTANVDGSAVEKMTHPTDERHRAPSYSPDGEELLFLSRDQEGIQSLHVMNEDGSKEKKLTDTEYHVRDAIFSLDGNEIYFIAVEADEYKKGEMSREGFDLYSMEASGSNVTKLTDNDHFSMNHLSLSPDGNTIYYSEFDGKDRIYSYSIESGTISTNPSLLQELVVNTHSFYEPQLSPSGTYIAFTDVSEESRESSLFEYELFLLDIESKEIERLTNIKKAVTSPTFFHQEEKLAFLENTNWSAAPDKYELKTVNTTTDEIESIALHIPKSSSGNTFLKIVDQVVNSFTIASLYIVVIVLLSIYIHIYRQGRVYVPSIVSFSIAILILLVSIVVAMTMDPWYGIGLGLLAAATFGCSIIAFLVVFIYRRFATS